MRRLLLSARPIHRVMTAVMSVACLALQLSGTFHLAVVEHGLCAEHGEAIDVSQSAEPRVRARDQDPKAEASASSGRSSKDGSHDHCLLAEDRAGRALVVKAANGALRSAPLVNLVPVQQERSVLSPSALRLLASKTSPPA